MNPNKPVDEIMYDVITDLFRAVHGQASMQKLEQLKRVGTSFAKALDKVAEKSCVDVFERLQKKVHTAFKAMEADINKLEVRVDEKLALTDDKLNLTDEKNKDIEIQLASIRKLAETVRAEIKALDNLFKGIGQ